MNEIYQRVAELLAKRVDALFESEDTLKAKFTELFPALPFDRTNHWGGIMYRVFRDCWLEAGPEVKGEPTGHDRNVVLRKLFPLLDYNLFTQVMLNLQSCAGMAYQARDAEDDIKKLQESWPKEAKLQPFEPKAKMVKEASSEEEKGYNLALSTLRSLKIIASFTPQISYRVSPKKTTPALTDSNNISMLGVGADKYLKVLPGLGAFYIHWVPETSPIMAIQQSDGGFKAEGVPYLFYSKSGGEILQSVLFSRKVTSYVFSAHDITTEACILLPRISSVLVVCNERGYRLKEAFEALRQGYPMLELAEGSRLN